jgi:hypothetical protein
VLEHEPVPVVVTVAQLAWVVLEYCASLPMD